MRRRQNVFFRRAYHTYVYIHTYIKKERERERERERARKRERKRERERERVACGKLTRLITIPVFWFGQEWV